MLNIDDPTLVQRTPAILRLAFRPLFLSAAVLAVLAISVWLALLQGSLTNLPVAAIWWHPHELLFGFALAIVVGFLLTAVQTWTGQASLTGLSLALLWSCWILARLALLLPAIPIALAALFDTLFILAAAWAMWCRVWRVKQWRNLGFAPLLALFAAANLASYWALSKADFHLASQIWLAALLWLVLMITIVGGRVIPFFCSMRLQTEKPRPILMLDISLYGLTLWLIVAAALTLPHSPLLRFTYLLTASLHLIRQARWSPHKTYAEPLLWSLQLSYLFIPLGLFGLAWADNPYLRTQILHLLAIGAMAGICLSMMARVSLGHTGRNIYAGPDMRFAFIAIALSALLRSLGPVLIPSLAPLFHHLSGALWILAFGWFCWHYSTVLARPRVDGRAG